MVAANGEDRLAPTGRAGPHATPTGDGKAVIYTVGHSTRPVQQLIDLLEQAAVRRLVDIRTVPRSRRNPQFEGPALARSLAEHGIEYRHEPALGGFRRPSPDSANRGWEQPAFRGYSDYMQTAQFLAALDGLMAQAAEVSSTVMCAEAQWWRCHRRLVADAVLVRGWDVLHLGLRAEPVAHQLTSFAVVGPDHALSYPPLQGELGLG